MRIVCQQTILMKCHALFVIFEKATKIVSEYDQEIPQSQTADNPVAPRGRAPQFEIVVCCKL